MNWTVYENKIAICKGESVHKLVVTVHVYLYFIYIIVGTINLFTVMTMWVRGGCHELDCL